MTQPSNEYLFLAAPLRTCVSSTVKLFYSRPNFLTASSIDLSFSM